MADTQIVKHQTKTVKRALYNWRIVLTLLKSVLMWERQWHPFAIFGVVSFLYLFNLFLDLSLITTFALLGLIINFFDSALFTIYNYIFGQHLWNAEKEKIYEDMCKTTVLYYNNARNTIETFLSLREHNPLMYFLYTNSTLWTVAWVSYNVDNELLIYLLTLLILLSPGSKHIKLPIRSLFYKAQKKD